MGYYINPSDESTKEEWLTKNGTPLTLIEAKEFDFGKDSLPVCLVDNGAFTAAGIAYCLEEEISNEPQFAADEFVRRLENHWTPAFMMALRKAITNKLIEHDQEFGTNFADRV